MKTALIVSLAIGLMSTEMAMAQFADPNTQEYWNTQPLPQVFVLPPEKRSLPIEMSPELPTNFDPSISPAETAAPSRVFLARPTEKPIITNIYTSPEYEAKVADMEAHNQKLREEWKNTMQQLYYTK